MHKFNLFFLLILLWVNNTAAQVITNNGNSPSQQLPGNSAGSLPVPSLGVASAVQVSSADNHQQPNIVQQTPVLKPAIVAVKKTVNTVVNNKVNVLKKPRPVMVGVQSNGVILNDKLSRANVISVKGDGTENALVSSRFPNRISTPFETPRVIDASAMKVQIDGSNIFFQSKSNDPVAIYITGGAPGDPVVSLTLMPRADIPAQTIILQLDAAATTKRVAKIESYSQQIIDLLRQVAADKVPDGFSEARMPNMLATQDGLNIIPEVRYSGSWLDIYRYKVENNQGTDIELSETQFYQNGVKAVAVYPNTILKRGESTNVFIVADKSMLDGVKNNGN